MGSNRWQRVEDLFHRVLDSVPEAREDLLQRVAKDDPKVAEEVLSLLGSADSAGSYFSDLAGRAGIPPVLADPDHLSEKSVGNYRLEKLLGRGGMGAVYLAERADEQFQKKAAVKLLPIGLLTEENQRRFLSERQILARLEHPNIARLLDGGVLEDGTPYFVMEYVEGRPIDTYCDERRLSVGNRLELFRTVCSAVQYAHRNLIVHRDLKPTNILVTGEGTVKLLDFGIARVLEPGSESVPSTLTRHALPMTPAFASPEQLRREPITTASDVYSLGILLYGLLAGRHPYDLSLRSPSEIEDIVCNTTPDPPSAVAGSVEEAAARGTTPDRLQRDLGGDLDTIVLTALRKDPMRRYSSAMSLAEDIGRHREGLPISARKENFRYVATKFMRRNKAGVAAVAGLVVLLATLAVVSLRFAITQRTQAQAITLERDRARTEAATAAEVSEFLVDLFQTADPTKDTADMTVRAMLDLGAADLRSSLKDQPEVRSRMMSVVADVYSTMGLHERSTEMLTEALAVRDSAFAPGDTTTIRLMVELAGELKIEGRRSEGIGVLQQALDRAPEESEVLSAGIRGDMSGLLSETGALDSALVMIQDALETQQRLLPPEHHEITNSFSTVGFIQRRRGELDAAQEAYEIALDRSRVYGASDETMGNVLNNLAYLHRVREELAEAEELYRESLVYIQKHLPEGHSTVLRVMANLAIVIFDQGREDEAESILLDVVERARDNYPEEHWRIGWTLESLARFYVETGKIDRAEPPGGKAVEIYESSLGPGNSWTLRAKGLLGSILTRVEKYSESETVLVGVYETSRKELGDDHRMTTTTLGYLIELYETWGKRAQAERYRALVEKTG